MSDTPAHHFIRGLLAALPPPDTYWSAEARAKWLRAAAACFDLCYTSRDGICEITIVAKLPLSPP